LFDKVFTAPALHGGRCFFAFALRIALLTVFSNIAGFDLSGEGW
jgi:hypothetical protein